MKDLLKVLVFGGLFAVLFLPMYVENSFFFPYITGKNFAFRIIVEIVFASWVLLALYEPKYRPKFSWILVAFGSLLAVMFVANMQGLYPPKSFWSNFERMDGYVTLVHVFMYMVVAGSVLTSQKVWSWFLHTSVAVALVVAVYGLSQYTGMIAGGKARVDSLLGNAAYMAVYMLFNIFFVAIIGLRSKITVHRVIYGLVALVLVYTLLLTGTRGTFIGFVGGAGVAVMYIALFGRTVPELRKYAVGGLVALTIFGLGFVAVKDMSFIQNTGPLARIANIDLSKDLVTRSTIWSIAWQGVKERPILGYGQGNFNYVFNEKYKASLYGQEQWFDRVHNIFFDWLIAGGFLGFIAYFSIMLAGVYYLLIEPVFLRRESKFTVLERAVLLGLIAGYLLHNVVVFDNIISYIFYGTLLALIHSRVGVPLKRLQEWKIEPVMITQFATPVVILIAGATIYFVNVSGIQAAGDVIDALVANTPQGRLQAFHTALSRESFARQEIVEQLAQQAMGIVGNPNVSDKDKQNMVQRAELELLSLIEDKPGDARLHNFLASFYRAIGALPQAEEQAKIATSLSPEKPSMIIEQGIIALQQNKLEEATGFMKQAFELDERNTQARVLYGAVLMRSGKTQEARDLIDPDYIEAFSRNDYAVSSTEAAGDFDFLAKLFEARIAQQPDNPQFRASRAFIDYQQGNIEGAIEVLKQAAEDIPSFANVANCYVDNLQKGATPDEGCIP